MFISIIYFLTIFQSLMMMSPSSSMSSISQWKTNKVKHIDVLTGLPLHSNIIEETLDMTERSIQNRKRLPDNVQKIKLKTDAKLHRRSCIILDIIQSLQSIRCLFHFQQQMILTFDSIINAVFVYNKWLISGAQFVIGGKEWGCQNRITQEPILIIQRIISFRIQKNKIILQTFKDVNLSPLVCFANITLSLMIEQGDLTTRIRSNKKRTISARKLVSDLWYFIPKVPHGREIYYPGQIIIIQWSYLNINGANQLKIRLQRKRFKSIYQLNYLNTYINMKNVSFALPLLSNISSHDKFFFQFDFYHEFLLYRKTSDIFYISNQPLIIPKTLSVENDIYFPGNSIRILWQSINFQANSQISVRFRRRDILIDSTLDRFLVCAILNNYTYHILPSLEQSSNDKYYYFEFDCM